MLVFPAEVRGMNAKELVTKIDQNPVVVKFSKEIEKIECECETNMVGRLYAYEIEEKGTPDEHYKIFIDFTGYENWNKGVAKPVYYDRDGKATLTVFETKFYSVKNDLYVMPTDEIGIIIEDDTIYGDNSSCSCETKEILDRLIIIEDTLNTFLDMLKKLEEERGNCK